MAGYLPEVQLLPAKWVAECEVTITAAGAVVPDANGNTTTDPSIVCTRTGAGTYRFDIPGNFQKVVRRDITFNSAAASSIQAQITAISLGGGTPTASGDSVTTVTAITGNSNAVPAAADQAAGVIAIKICFQKNKI